LHYTEVRPGVAGSGAVEKNIELMIGRRFKKLARPVPNPTGSSLQDPEGRDGRPGENSLGSKPHAR